MKLPSLLTGLGSTSNNLVKVPAQIAYILEISPKVLISFKEVFK